GLAFVRARLEDGHFNDAAETAGLEQLLDDAPVDPHHAWMRGIRVAGQRPARPGVCACTA
ncbi:hypothetical protein C7E17_25530, partial [Stenotrophomonas maltophilia]